MCHEYTHIDMSSDLFKTHANLNNKMESTIRGHLMKTPNGIGYIPKGSLECKKIYFRTKNN